MIRIERKRKKDNNRERDRRKERGIVHPHICIYASYMRTYDCVSIVGVASVAADVAAVPRYQRGCLDALHRSSRHDLSALSTAIRYLPFCPVTFPLCLFRLLDPRSAMRASHLRPVALRTLRFVQGRRRCIWYVCDRTPCWPIRCEGNGSRERRLMRSLALVSLNYFMRFTYPFMRAAPGDFCSSK